MFSKLRGAAIAAALCCTMPATAQVDSESMDDITAWGARYESGQEVDFPSSLWRHSDNQILLGLMQSQSTDRLTGAERTLLRRLVLSPARKPSGEQAEALLSERVRLMLELGEADAAAQLAPRLQQTPEGLNAETFAIDLELARGEEDAACRHLEDNPPDGLYGLKLRAVCAVLAGNISGAEIAVEVASVQGLDDPWFVSAIFAAAGDSPNPPEARFDNGMNIALSLKAGLDTSALDPLASRADLAAALALREGVPGDLRVAFAEMARRADLLPTKAHRAIVMNKLAENAAVASSAIEETLFVFEDPLTFDSQRAEALDHVFQSAASGSLNEFAMIASLFLPELKRLPQSPDTAPYSLDFARAALAAGDNNLADTWLKNALDAPDFEIAYLQALLLIAGGDASISQQNEIQESLLESSDNEARLARATDLLATWTGFEFVLSAPARAGLLLADRDNAALPPNERLAIQSAIRDGAIGEAALMILAQTQGEPQTLASADLAELLRMLREIEAGDIAVSLALEASEFWKREDSETAG